MHIYEDDMCCFCDVLIVEFWLWWHHYEGLAVWHVKLVIVGLLGWLLAGALPGHDSGQVILHCMPLSPSSIIWYWRCGKFVAPGKFFPPVYSHDVTNPNSNLSPNLNPTPNPNHSINPYTDLNPNPCCCMWELFSGVTNFPLHLPNHQIGYGSIWEVWPSASMPELCLHSLLAWDVGNRDEQLMGSFFHSVLY